MAKFKITDNVSGKTVTVSGDSPPSEQEAEEIFRTAGLRDTTEPPSPTFAGLGGGKATGIQTPFPEWKQKTWKAIGEPLPELGGAVGSAAGLAAVVGTPAKHPAVIPGAAAAGRVAGKGAQSLIAKMLGMEVAPIGEANLPQEAVTGASQGALDAILMRGAAPRPINTSTQGMVPGEIDTAVGKFMDKDYERIARPAHKGRGSFNQKKAFKDRSTAAVRDIAENPSTLRLGEAGEARLPQNVEEFSQAISQRKKQVFDQYDAMQKAAGQQGITVDLSSLKTELQGALQSQSLKLSDPKAYTKARTLLKKISDTPSVSPQVAQEMVTNWNHQINYGDATQLGANGIQKMAANNLRQSLDKTVSTWPKEYQQLKNVYGSLRQTETNVFNQSNKTGLPETLANIGTWGELAVALGTGSPAHAAGAVGLQVGKHLAKRARDPNLATKRMFEGVSGVLEKGKAASEAATVERQFQQNIAGSPVRSLEEIFGYQGPYKVNPTSSGTIGGTWERGVPRRPGPETIVEPTQELPGAQKLLPPTSFPRTTELMSTGPKPVSPDPIEDLLKSMGMGYEGATRMKTDTLYWFTDPKTGSTLAMKASQIKNPGDILTHILESRAKFDKGATRGRGVQASW